MSTEPQLITYVDRLAGDLRGLDEVLRLEFAGAFSGVHLLPFYPPIDGSDAGFDPVDHTAVDPRLGDWDDVARIGSGHRVMADLIVNHVSSHSSQFQDWAARGAASAFDGMFLTRDDVFPEGASREQLEAIYRPRPWPPFTTFEIAGVSREVWTTFTNEQVDLDVSHPSTWAYLMTVLDRFREVGVDLVRLDAIGYAVKRAGTSCFMIPECFAFIERIAKATRQRGMNVLVEVHSHHRFQIEVASRVDRVYDFALPPLVLYSLLHSDAEPLGQWLDRAPRNCVTVLDTHDGIGMVDVAPEGEEAGLLTAEQVDRLITAIHAASGGTSVKATGSAAMNLDSYQINCTFYDAVGQDDDAHFLARLVQMLVPGIPQVYYAGLLAAPNQVALLSDTGVGRDINRPYYDDTSRRAALEQPVVRATLDLLRWRAQHDAVFQGSFTSAAVGSSLHLEWDSPAGRLQADIDFAERSFRVDLDGEQIVARDGFG